MQFTVRGLEPGVHQGLVRLVGEDGLALDDVRLLCGGGAAGLARAGRRAGRMFRPSYLVEMLAPRELRETGQARFPRARRSTSRGWPSQELADYRAVALLDPKPLTPDDVDEAGRIRQAGGGLAVFLGHNAEPPASFQDPAAIGVLGGKLTRQTRTGGDIYHRAAVVRPSDPGRIPPDRNERALGPLSGLLPLEPRRACCRRPARSFPTATASRPSSRIASAAAACW